MKKTYTASKIVFNIFAILFGFVMLASTLSLEMKDLITEQVFGGYKTEIVTVGEGEDGDTEYFKTFYNSLAELKATSNNICIAVESEGAVLLKNDNSALPLDKGSKVSLFSVTSVDPIYGMGGAGKINIDVNEQLSYKDTMEDAGLVVNEALYDWYKQNTVYHRTHPGGNGVNAEINDAPWGVIPDNLKTDAEYGDAAIFIIGRWGNEAIDLPPVSTGSGTGGLTDGDYLKLTPNEVSVLKGLKAEKDKGTFDKIIVLVNSANPIQEDFAHNPEYGVDAALWIGLTGTSGLYAVADILVGDVTPSGRLPDMWYSSRHENPTTKNFGNFSYSGQGGTRRYVVYQEGIYVGYRYAETRYEDTILGRENAGDYDYNQAVVYPFGHGLSYTTFEYSDFDVTYDSQKDEYTVTVKVTNKGTYPGKEVVQVYLQQPYTQYDIENKIEKSAVDLVGFAKTSKLDPAESETVEIVVEGKYFASYDAWGHGTYYLDAGDYYLTAAKDSHDAINNILAKKGKTTDDGMDAPGNADLVWKTTLEASAEKHKNASLTGKEIVNLFDESDINRLNDGVNSVKYFSRSNWTDTVGSTAKIQDSAKIRAGYALDRNGGVKPDDKEYPTYGKIPTAEEYPQYAHLIKEDYYNGEARIPLAALRADLNGDPIPFDDPLWDVFLDQLTWEETVMLLSDGLRKTRAVDSVGKPATVDHNGSCGYNQRFNNGPSGLATRYNDPDKNSYPTGYPCSGIIAATFNTKLAEVVGIAIGEDSLWSGQAGLYGLGLNLHRNPYHGRYAEYYSEDAFLTGVISGYQTKGIQSKGAYVYNKHFVLNDQEVNRTSYETWITEQALRQNHLRPFEIAIQIGNAKNVMTAFNRLGSVWSGNVYNLCTAYLRGECGMQGFAVTDWYPSGGMGIAGGVLAGNDLPDGSDGSLNSFANKGPGNGYGGLAQAMRLSVHRIMYTVVQSNAMNFLGSNIRIITYEPEWVGVVGIVRTVSIIAFAVASAFLLTMVVLTIFKKYDLLSKLGLKKSS